MLLVLHGTVKITQSRIARDQNISFGILNCVNRLFVLNIAKRETCFHFFSNMPFSMHCTAVRQG